MITTLMKSLGYILALSYSASVAIAGYVAGIALQDITGFIPEAGWAAVVVVGLILAVKWLQSSWQKDREALLSDKNATIERLRQENILQRDHINRLEHLLIARLGMRSEELPKAPPHTLSQSLAQQEKTQQVGGQKPE